MKKNIFILIVLIGMISFAQNQTGIGTKTPTTTLEVVANAANNMVLDGITIPKLTCSQIINKQLNAPMVYGTPQTGTIIYITDTSDTCAGAPVTEVAIKGIGFYVFNGTEFIKIALDSGFDTTKWDLSGNTGTDPATSFIGTVDAQDLAIRTNNTDAIRVDASGNVGIRTTIPAADLEVMGNASDVLKTDGITIPKITGDQLRTKNINSAYGAAQTGTLMYVNAPATAPATADLTENVVAAGLYYFDGATWQVTAKHSVGDIKQGFQIADHDGWVLLNGRNVNTLSATQQAAFAAMFPAATNIQNTTNARGASQNSATYLANIDGNPNTVGTIGGNIDNVWARSDLPNLNHNHAADDNDAGGHAHAYSRQGAFLNSQGGGGGSNAADTTATTDSAGSHNHNITVSNRNPGGSNANVPTSPRTLDVNTFIYLGN